MTAGDYSIGSDHWPGLSKLIEEAGEMLQVGGKLMGTGGDPNHWDGSDLIERLHEELADLGAAISFFVFANGDVLDEDRIFERKTAKFRQFIEWHETQ